MFHDTIRFHKKNKPVPSLKKLMIPHPDFNCRNWNLIIFTVFTYLEIGLLARGYPNHYLPGVSPIPKN